MAFGIAKLLRTESMQEMYREGDFAFSRPKPFTENFWSSPSSEDLDDFVYLGDPAENRPTPLNVRGGDANMLQPADAKKRRGVLFHLFNGITFGKAVHEAIAEPGSKTLDLKGTMEVQRQMQHFRERHLITKEVVLSKIITKGKVVFNNKTKVIEEAAAGGDDTVIDLGVAASHQGDLNGLRQGTLFDPDWDILAFFRRVRTQALAENVPTPTDVWLSAANLEYLLNNTQYQLWAAKNGRDSEQALRGEVVEGVFGKRWHFIEGGYQDAGGTIRNYMPDDMMILTPPVNTGWLKASRGGVLVPTNTGLVTDVEAALRAEQWVYGEHAYACVELKEGRTRYNAYAGDCFGLNFIEPGAIWQMDLPEVSSSSSSG